MNIQLAAVEITALYAGILALLFAVLSFRVSLARMTHRVNIGAGGNPEVEKRMRVQGNFAEYVPLLLVLMLVAELNGAAAEVVHLFGIVLVAARVLHAWGLQAGVLLPRQIGAAATYLLVVAAGLYGVVLGLG